jgi:NAD(P)-dependent dehydrogenase (short-subunit alcohol dehydrogenase family)
MARTIIITGASDGIGAAAARQLAKAGHQLVLVGRSPERTQAVARAINALFYIADFTRLDEVRRLAAELDAAVPRIDVLANNAGGVFDSRRVTDDGFEVTFQVNHLAPFLLTNLLMPKLIASQAALVQTSSVGARMVGKLDITDLNFERTYSALAAYGTVKLENILFTRELHRRYHAAGLSAVAFHPGNVATSFGSQSRSLIGMIARNPIVRRLMLITPEQGGAELARFAGGTPGKDWLSGLYYEKGVPAKRENPQAGDAALAQELWRRSAQLLGIDTLPPDRAIK